MAGGRMVRRGQSFSRLAWAVALAVLAALGLACSDAGPAPVDVTAGQPEVADDSTKMPEDAADSPGDPVGSDAAAALGCDFPAAPMPGQPGAACGKGKDCDSGWCVEGPTGKVCSRLCSSCCPAGFSCEAPSPQDPVFICISKLNALCRPCDQDSECQGLSSGALCIGDAVQGRFCGGACSDDDECPANYQCLTAQGTKGAGLQCVRIQGECPCSARSVAEGASTSCAKVGSAGSCPGQRKCLLTGLSACSAAAPATETCGGGDEDCDGATDEAGALNCQTWYPDQDGDGYASSSAAGSCVCTAAGIGYAAVLGDCDDAAKAVSPVASENCNGIDDDCDGKTDEGSADLDGDGSADCIDGDIDGDGSLNAADCAPTDPAISPTATEACNGADDDCDAATDEEGAKGCQIWWWDGDADGFGKAQGAGGQQKCLCAAQLSFTAAVGGDCNDASPAIHPNAADICNDADDDCDGKTDSGCDDDQDGWCDAKMAVVGEPAVCPKGKKDCDDNSAAVSPGAKEVCGTGIDEDCDGATDAGAGAAGCKDFYADGDGDGFGSGAAQCLCSASAAASATKGGDCDDTDKAKGPSAGEACDGKDNDCDGATDEVGATGCTPWYIDGDGDKVGVAASAQCQCGATLSHPASKAGDCNDGNPAVAPGAPESCDGLDNDCDGATDEVGATGCTPWYIDGDGDKVGVAASAQCQCGATLSHPASKAGDCNDANPAIAPGAPESCDGLDNDCDGATDEVGATGCTPWYIDGDGDKVGVAASAQCQCGASASHSASKAGDCNDANPAVAPGAPESCDGLDNDCDGATDPAKSFGCSIFLADQDKDGYGSPADSQCLCKPAFPYTSAKGGDCNDQVASQHPGVAEACDGIDNDCDGVTDGMDAQNCSLFFVDVDKDGYGNALAAPKCLCGSTGSYTAVVSGDCDDTDLATHPKAVEQCDGKDTDCDGIKDPKNAQGCKVYYLDFDNDGFGANNMNQCQCSAEIPYTVLKAGDCNDTTKMVNPGMLESCNQVDDNCNGQTDDGAPGTTSYYQDGDGDGFGIGSAKLLCGASAPYTATKAGDCNDGAKTVYPGAAEIQCNTVDENCDGKDSCTAAGHICDTSCGSASPPPGATVACACDLYCPMNGDCCNPTGTGFAANCGTQSTCIWCKAF